MVEDVLLDVGHQLLLRMDYKNTSDIKVYRIQQTIKECYSGSRGAVSARELCHQIKAGIDSREVYAFQIDHVFDALFEVQPVVALDEFLLEAKAGDEDPIYGSIGLHKRSPLEKVEPTILWSWADSDPDIRYSLISRTLNVFSTKNFDEDNGLSPLFIEGLEKAPDRTSFLASNRARMLPNSWSGNLSTILDRRREYLSVLTEHPDQSVRAWALECISNLKQWADSEREREVEREESFE